MISVNDNIKQAYSLSTTQIDRIILNGTPYYITNVEYSDNCYQDGNVFGTAEARQLAFEIENSVNLERQEYEYQTGIVVNGEVEWISLGNFITFDTEEDDTNGITKVNAMDNMIKSNVLYDHTSLDYSVGVTIKEILEDVLEQCGLELGTSSFVNSNFVCYSDQFEDNALIRQVIIACAQISGTFAKIRSDNKLYLINPNKALYGDLVTEEDIYLKTEKGNKLILLERRIDKESGVAESNTFFDLRDYENTTLKRNTHEINTLVLGLSNVEGENVTVRDEDMIAEDGNENKIVINDNPFAYTQALRTQLINPIFNSIKGFAYTAYELKCQGLPYLECGDSVSVKTMEGNSIESYVFRYTFKSPNGLDSTIEAPSLTDAEVLYENVENLDTRLKRTEIIVDKESQQITSIVAQIGDRSEKTTTITQDIDGIESIVEETIDITRDVEDTDPLTLTNALKGDLLELHIYGNNEVFSHLYPNDDLFPSDDLFPKGDSRIKIYTKNKCPDGIDNWVNGYFTTGQQEGHSSPWNEASLLSEYIPIDELTCFFSIEDENYRFWNIHGFDENKQYVAKASWNWGNTNCRITFGTGTKYARMQIVNKDYHYNEVDYENNYPPITPAEIMDIKPMMTYSNTKQEYAGYNNFYVDLGVNEVLRRLEKPDGTIIRDSYDLVNNNATITRRIGIDGSGEPYDLITPVVTDLGEMKIPIAEGENIFEIINYNATCKARWVIRNVYTNTFASTVELESSITQLASSINLQVSKKVNNNEVIARINMAILNRDEAEVPEDIEKSIIEILANKISITSDYFEITRYGEATFKKGYIGNWNLLNGHLYSDHIESGTGVRSGLVSRDNYNTFLYAGLSPSAQHFDEANFMVKNNGLCKAKWFTVNGESGYFYVNYDSGRTALQFTKEGLFWKLDNTNNNNFANLTTAQLGVFLHLYDAPGFYIRDSVHNLSLFSIIKVAPESGQQAEMMLYPKAYYYAGTNTGYEIATRNDICDESVKKNIKECKEKALEKINKIEFKQFEWNKTKIDKEGHVGIGITAQQVKEIDENFVEKTSVCKIKETKNGEEKKTEQELYTINILNMLTTSMKAIQELSSQVKELEKEIEKLKSKKGE